MKQSIKKCFLANNKNFVVEEQTLKREQVVNNLNKKLEEELNTNELLLL